MLTNGKYLRDTVFKFHFNYLRQLYWSDQWIVMLPLLPRKKKPLYVSNRSLGHYLRSIGKTADTNLPTQEATFELKQGKD